MAISVRLRLATPLGPIQNRFRRFQKGVDEKWGPMILKRIASKIQKSAKLRAPRFTGFLASQIHIRPLGKKRIEVTSEAPYAYFQEYGYDPHKIPIEWISMHKAGPGTRGAWVTRPERMIQVRRFKPHIRPAVEAVRPKVRDIAEDEIRRAIVQSFR